MNHSNNTAPEDQLGPSIVAGRPALGQEASRQMFQKDQRRVGTPGCGHGPTCSARSSPVGKPMLWQEIRASCSASGTVTLWIVRNANGQRQ